MVFGGVSVNPSGLRTNLKALAPDLPTLTGGIAKFLFALVVPTLGISTALLSAMYSSGPSIVDFTGWLSVFGIFATLPLLAHAAISFPAKRYFIALLVAATALALGALLILVAWGFSSSGLLIILWMLGALLILTAFIAPFYYWGTLVLTLALHIPGGLMILNSLLK